MGALKTVVRFEKFGTREDAPGMDVSVRDDILDPEEIERQVFLASIARMLSPDEIDVDMQKRIVTVTLRGKDVVGTISQEVNT